MFTGIVDHCGRIEAVERHEGSLRLVIGSSFSEIKVGESISVDGACLTVVSENAGAFQVDVSPETARLTLAPHYQVGTQVNLERGLRVGDRMGGHWVTGHVDTSLCLSQREDRDGCVWMRFDGFPRAARPLLTQKGWICINGVSLTVNEVSDSHFAVLLVPHTLKSTNLHSLLPGSAVNIEWDWMAKMITEAIQTRISQGDPIGKISPIH